MTDDVKVANWRERITAAIERIVAGRGPMRIPADMTDPDIVLSDCLAHIEGEAARTATAVAAATSPVPGLAASGAYSAADVDIIEAHRGRPYERLRETVAELDALRAQVERVRKVALNTMALGDDDIRPQDVLDALEGRP